MTLLFSLAIPKDAQADLEKRVANGEVVPLDELQQKYSPSAADVEALVSWLKAQGFKIMEVSNDRTSVYARADARRRTKESARPNLGQVVAHETKAWSIKT